jgi:pyrroloquinoline quinone biosynthesis protein D
MSIVAKQTNRFSETEIDGEIIVMHLGTGEFFSLTGSAAATWQLMDGTRDRGALVKELAARFDGPEAKIASDVDQFLKKLTDMGLVAIG